MGESDKRPEPREYFWLWSVDECAEALRMSPGTLRNLGEAGPPKVRLGGRVWYRPDGVQKWLELREK
jgi:hypothetical protein